MQGSVGGEGNRSASRGRETSTRFVACLTVSGLLELCLLLICACSGGGSGGSKTDTTPPATTVTSPNGGEFLSAAHSITWTTTDASPGTVEIRLSGDGGATFPAVLAAAAADTGSYLWDTTGHPDGASYRIQITPTDDAGNVGIPVGSLNDFTIDNTDPVVTLTSPAGGEFLSGSRNITWTTVDDNPSTVEILLSSVSVTWS